MIQSQSETIASIQAEHRLKMQECDRQQTQIEEQHEHIQKLHAKLENALKSLSKLEQHSLAHAQLKEANDRNVHDLKKSSKQIEKLRASLMTSESERLILRKQYLEIGHKLEEITAHQNKSMEQMQQNEREKNEQIMQMQKDLNVAMCDNESLRKKLHKQSHSMSKNMG